MRISRLSCVVVLDAAVFMLAGCGYGHAVYDLAPDYHERMKNFLESSF
jgi:hypothetical protein